MAGVIAGAPLQIMTVPNIAVAIPRGRFVSYSGGLCANAARALGVSNLDCDIGGNIGVSITGTEAVLASAPIPVGSPVTSDAEGKARVATTGESVNGRALTTGVAGKELIILLNVQ